jgi:hypothetical protein
MLLADRVEWWEPYRSTCRSRFAELRSAGVFDFRRYARAALLGVIVMVPIVALAMWLAPGLSVSWVQLVAGLLLAAFVLPLLAAGMVILPPTHVRVTREFVQINHGEGATRIDKERIDSIALQDGDDAGSMRLAIQFRTPRGRSRTRTFAVSARIDREALAALLEYLRPS